MTGKFSTQVLTQQVKHKHKFLHDKKVFNTSSYVTGKFSTQVLTWLGNFQHKFLRDREVFNTIFCVPGVSTMSPQVRFLYHWDHAIHTKMGDQWGKVYTGQEKVNQQGHTHTCRSKFNRLNIKIKVVLKIIYVTVQFISKYTH